MLSEKSEELDSWEQRSGLMLRRNSPGPHLSQFEAQWETPCRQKTPKRRVHIC